MLVDLNLPTDNQKIQLDLNVPLEMEIGVPANPQPAQEQDQVLL
jgi:hypothetical protein